MYPNTLNEEVRRVLWPRCLQMMLDIGFGYVEEESQLKEKNKNKTKTKEQAATKSRQPD